MRGRQLKRSKWLFEPALRRSKTMCSEQLNAGFASPAAAMGSSSVHEPPAPCVKTGIARRADRFAEG